MITIVDYGLGNILAFSNAFKILNVDVRVARTSADLRDARHLILPGVGSFDHAMSLLNGSGMRETLDELVLDRKVPVLGICVGMQILGMNSEEGQAEGLGWIDGNVRRLRPAANGSSIQLPHMGWNDVNVETSSELFRDIARPSIFYFLHSYGFACSRRQDVLAETEYEVKFPSAVRRDNIYGVQFHPEKSHRNGLLLLKNFSGLSNA